MTWREAMRRANERARATGHRFEVKRYELATGGYAWTLAYAWPIERVRVAVGVAKP
jgi:hypothetical protein